MLRSVTVTEGNDKDYFDIESLIIEVEKDPCYIIKINSLSLNLNKTNYVHFTAKSNTKFYININFEDIQINNIYNKVYWINYR